VGCAAALATIDVLTAPGFLESAAARGRGFLTGLESVRSRHPALAENRGVGLMLASEIVDETGQPDGARAAAVLEHLLCEDRIVAMTCGPFGSTVRWIPPLVIGEDEVTRTIEAFERALDATATAPQGRSDLEGVA
jgi:4-aminobutyrate aminotransferase